MSDAAKAYARVAQTTAAPREIEAQALLKAANKLQDLLNNKDETGERTKEALLFNRKLWSIFMSDALRDENPQPEHYKSLIEINRNLAAGLSGRA